MSTAPARLAALVAAVALTACASGPASPSKEGAAAPAPAPASAPAAAAAPAPEPAAAPAPEPAAAPVPVAASVPAPAPEAPAGLVREAGPMAKVLERSKGLGRPVMVDFYTEWCGWCKWMDKNVFSDAQVQSACNDGFLVFAIDAEKGEGIALAAKYGVHGFPTYVFVDSTGEELDRQVGASKKAEFLPFLGDVKEGRHLKALEDQVAKGPEDSGLQARLGMKLARRQDPAARVHLEKAVALDGKDALPATVEARFFLALLDAQEGQTGEPLKDFAGKYPDSPSAVDAHRILVNVARQEHDEAAELASLEIIARRAPDAETRNELSWILATRGKDLDRALSLVEAALAEDPKNSAYLDTRAECLSRLGRLDEAVAAQKEAVANLDPRMPPEQRAEYENRLAAITKRRDEAKK